MKKSEITPKQVSSVTCPACNVAIRKSVNEDRTGFCDITKTTTKVLAPYSEYPYKESDEKLLRRELDDKIRNILASVNVQNGGKGTNGNGTSTLAELIERNYFPRA